MVTGVKSSELKEMEKKRMQFNKIKKLMSILLCITMIFVVVGCSKEEKKETAVTKEQIDSFVSQSIESDGFKDELAFVDEEKALDQYGITKEEIESITAYLGTGASAEELVCIKTKDTDKIKSLMTQHLEEQKKNFESYLPDEVPKIESALVEVKGDYVIVCVADKIDAIKKLQSDNL